MRISGAIEDASVAGVLQVIHLAGRSGRLLLECEGRRAEIEFRLGRMVSAWSEAAESVEDILVRRGTLSTDELSEARADLEIAGPSLVALGDLLLARGQIDAGQHEAAVLEHLESVISGTLSWKHGTFVFLVATDGPAARTAERLPETTDTQRLILDAVRRQASESGGWKYETLGIRPEQEEVACAPAPSLPEAALLQIVSNDSQLVSEVQNALAGELRVVRVALRDGGMAPPGVDTLLVLLDLRNAVKLEELELLARRRPRAIPIAVASDDSMITAAFCNGAAIALPYHPSSIASCVRGMLACRLGRPNLSSEKLTIRRILGFLDEIRSGVFSATMSLSLMSMISEYVERAALFVPRGGALYAIGAFGQRLPKGPPLIDGLRGLVVPLSAAPGLRLALEQRKAQRLPCTGALLSEELVKRLGVPSAGAGVLIPVIGRTHLISAVYADNGTLPSEVSSMEEVEVAVSQVGLALESELLQRRLDGPSLARAMQP